MSGIWRSAWMALGRKRLRTLLTVSSIAIGTAMVVLILCIGQIGSVAIGDELTFTLFDDVTITLTLKKKMPSPFLRRRFVRARPPLSTLPWIPV